MIIDCLARGERDLATNSLEAMANWITKGGLLPQEFAKQLQACLGAAFWKAPSP
jgi:hypothetical protein